VNLPRASLEYSAACQETPVIVADNVSDLVFTRVARAGDVAESAVIKVQARGVKLALFNLQGVHYATDELCPHALASLVNGFILNDTVECTLHGACYSIKTGEPLLGTATPRLKTYPVRNENGEILVGVPANEHKI
jgi:nitrite reductase/ring-hydroxylating ferredoxin subunit